MKNPVFRVDELMRLCTNKSVLHLGYVHHSNEYEEVIKNGQWAHANIGKVASSICGIDYLAKEVEIIRDKFGYEGYFGDVTRLEEVKLDRKFDVIVCGELIEHITNPGLMLDGIKRFMHKDSILILTTPNPWGRNFIKRINKGNIEENWINLEHVSWYSFFTLKNTLVRHGYSEVNYGYYFGFVTKNEFFSVSGALAPLKTVKRNWLIATTRHQNQLGLFFVSRLAV